MLLFFTQVRNPQNNMCLDTFGHREGGHLSVFACHGQAGNQEFGFTDLNELQFEDDLCLDVPSHHVGAPVVIYNCHGLGGNQKWEYNEKVRDLCTYKYTQWCIYDCVLFM